MVMLWLSHWTTHTPLLRFVWYWYRIQDRKGDAFCYKALPHFKQWWCGLKVVYNVKFAVWFLSKHLHQNSRKQKSPGWATFNALYSLCTDSSSPSVSFKGTQLHRLLLLGLHLICGDGHLRKSAGTWGNNGVTNVWYHRAKQTRTLTTSIELDRIFRVLPEYVTSQINARTSKKRCNAILRVEDFLERSVSCCSSLLSSDFSLSFFSSSPWPKFLLATTRKSRSLTAQSFQWSHQTIL